MNLGELISTARSLADDSQADALWSDEELTAYANEGEREAARRSRLILDIDTETDDENQPVCVYPVTTGATTIAPHRKVIFVRRVTLASADLPLQRTRLKDMDLVYPGWESHPASEVITYVPNWRTGKLRFYTAFPADDTVTLQVVRLPLYDMTILEDEPELEDMHHMGIVNWMLFRCFAKPDPDTKDKVKAADYLAMFEQDFGPRSSAINQAWIQREHGYDDFEGLF